MTDEQRKAEPEEQTQKGENQQHEVEDLAPDAADAEQVKGGGWPWATATTYSGMLGG
jgi:hypothetical protein